MDKFEHNPGNGSLFKNNKRTSEKSPAYSGSGKIAYPPSPDGGELNLDLAAWVKEGKNGKFLSLSLKEDTYNTYTPGTDQSEDDEDVIPW